MEDRIRRLEHDIQRLKVAYDQYFSGIERRPPDMLADKVDICTVQAISQVARSVGIETVAEQVESRAVLEKLREIGVDYAQGYHIARPAPMTEFDISRRYG